MGPSGGRTPFFQAKPISPEPRKRADREEQRQPGRREEKQPDPQKASRLGQGQRVIQRKGEEHGPSSWIFEAKLEFRQIDLAIKLQERFPQEKAFRIARRIREHFVLLDKLFDLPNRLDPSQTVKYRILMDANGQVRSVELIAPKLPVAKSAGEIQAEEAVQASIENLDIPQHLKDALLQSKDILADFDTWVLGTYEYLEEDIILYNHMVELRNTIGQFQSTVDSTIAYADMAEKTARLLVDIQTTAATSSPGSRGGLLALTRLAAPAGELLESISGKLPPGLSHFCKALGQAAKRVPAFFENMTKLMSRKEQMRRQGQREAAGYLPERYYE